MSAISKAHFYLCISIRAWRSSLYRFLLCYDTVGRADLDGTCRHAHCNRSHSKMRVGKGKEVERLPIIDSRLAEACTLKHFVANHRFLRIARLPIISSLIWYSMWSNSYINVLNLRKIKILKFNSSRNIDFSYNFYIT